MAAGSKTFKTVFELAAKYTGASAFSKLNKDIDKTERNVKTASAGMGRMFGTIGKITTAIGGAALAYKALTKAQDFWSMGVKASEDAIKVQESLGVAAAANAKRYKTSGDAIVASVNQVSEKVAAVGFDTEDATAGVTKLLASMSPKQIEGFASAYGDIVAKLKGATPGMEGFAEVSNLINKAVLKGKQPSWFRQEPRISSWLFSRKWLLLSVWFG
jgi:hypothetical protein